MARDQFRSEEDLRGEPWAEQANCKGKAFELFEYQEKDSPLASGMDFKTRLAFNHTNFELAAEICIECPVFFECGENATGMDKYWTVRQGEPPKRFGIEQKQFENSERPAADPSKTRICHRGHVVEGGGRCKTCKRLSNAARREAKNAVS